MARELKETRARSIERGSTAEPTQERLEALLKYAYTLGHGCDGYFQGAKKPISKWTSPASDERERFFDIHSFEEEQGMALFLAGVWHQLLAISTLSSTEKASEERARDATTAYRNAAAAFLLLAERKGSDAGVQPAELAKVWEEQVRPLSSCAS